MEQLTLTMDLLVLGTSGCAVLYCGQLARRLERLRSAEGATPRALAALSNAVEASQRSAREIAEAAERATADMEAAFAAVDARRRAAEDLSGILDGQAAHAEGRVRQAREAGEAALASLSRRAQIELEALEKAVGIAARASGAARAAEGVPAAPIKLSDHGQARQRAAAGANPFRKSA